MANDDLQRLLLTEPVGVEDADAVIDVVVAGADGREIHRVPVRLTSRVRGAGRVELWGAGEAGRLAVHVALTPEGRMTVQLRVTEESAGARETLRLLDLIESLVPPHRVAVVPSGSAPGLAEPLSRRLVPTTPPGLRRVLEDLALIEEAVGERITVPEKFTAADRVDIAMTAKLLRGEEVIASWNTVRWTLASTEAAELRDGVFADDGEAQFDYETEWQLSMGGTTWPIGIVLVILDSAEVREMAPPTSEGLAGDDPVVLTLGPRSSDRIRYRLVAVGPSQRDDGSDQRWFWTESWQGREREVDVAVAAGRVTTFASSADFVAHLDALGSTAP